MSKQANGAQVTKVVTGVVRLSYVHLFEKYASPGSGEPKYSVALLIPKTDKVTLKKIRSAQLAALEIGKTSRFNGVIPKKWHSTLRDGDEEMDLEKNPEYEGHYFMNVSAKTPPGVVDRNLVEIVDSTEVYSGCYARVSINAFAYNTQGNKGVSFGLNHVQKIKDGEHLGGRSKAEDDFDDDFEDDDEDLLG